jgi:fructosamine-3-kinase
MMNHFKDVFSVPTDCRLRAYFGFYRTKMSMSQCYRKFCSQFLKGYDSFVPGREIHTDQRVKIEAFYFPKIGRT